jgi:nitroreductase
MTTITRTEQSELLRRAAEQAGLAPSVHNSQPWRFRLGSDFLDLRADRERRLQVLDPGGRQLIISCGCALMNARVALAAERQEVTVERYPDADDPDLLARLTLTGRPAPWTPLVRLAPAIGRRHSNRREFFEREVPEEVQWELSNAAAQEDAILTLVATDEARATTARLVQTADAIENQDPAYLAEIREWTTDIATRPDGVTARSYPMSFQERGDVPIRDFGAKVHGQMTAVTDSDRQQCLMILGTEQDNPHAWLRAGEALERLWLEATRLDYVASLINQVIEVRQTRTQLRQELDLPFFPHLLLRVGQAAPNIATNRRALDDVIEAVVEPAEAES